MVRRLAGLILTPRLNAQGMSALDIHFEPAMIISARKVDKLGIDIRSFREPLKRSIQQVVIPSIRKNFDVGGRNPKWPALAPQTVKRKGGNSRPLIRTGKLRRTMGYLNIWTIDREKAFIQDLPDSIWYGKVHQAGAKGQFENFYDPVKKRKVNIGDDGAIPQREFVVLRRKDEIDIERVFEQWLEERIRHAGLVSTGI